LGQREPDPNERRMNTAACGDINGPNEVQTKGSEPGRYRKKSERKTVQNYIRGARGQGWEEVGLNWGRICAIPHPAKNSKRTIVANAKKDSKGEEGKTTMVGGSKDRKPLEGGEKFRRRGKDGTKSKANRKRQRAAGKTDELKTQARACESTSGRRW